MKMKMKMAGRRSSPRKALAAVLFVAAALSACATGLNYTEPSGPRYVGGSVAPSAPAAALKLVSFNIQWADSIDAAIRLLREEPALRDADVVFLQEMDEPGTSRIAEALGLAWVYYPAIRRTKTGEDFGNAVLSRWPIERDEKLILPHRAIFGKTQRIATAATLRIGGLAVRVYSAHLGTGINLASPERRDQLRAILDDARAFRHVVVAGDMNDEHVGDLALERGWAWPTRRLPKTTALGPIGVGTWDHVFLKGFASPPAGAAGVVTPSGEVSDHKPVWAIAAFL